MPPDERVSGPGASYVMASFTHLNPRGSRFSDGSFGVYYAASELETAIAETIFHFEEFARDSGDPMRMEDMRVLVGGAAAEFEDVAALAEPRRSQILDPSSYAISRTYARELREAGANGVVYPSVRRAGGECIGAFRPRAVRLPHQERHLKYLGTAIAWTAISTICATSGSISNSKRLTLGSIVLPSPAVVPAFDPKLLHRRGAA